MLWPFKVNGLRLAHLVHYVRSLGRKWLRSFCFGDKTYGRAVGYAGPFRPEGFPENEIGWTIWNEIDEGNGFAEEATRSVLDYCREDLGWTEIVSYIDPSLSRAVSFAVKMGAVLDAAASKPAWEQDALVYRYLK